MQKKIILSILVIVILSSIITVGCGSNQEVSLELEFIPGERYEYDISLTVNTSMEDAQDVFGFIQKIEATIAYDIEETIASGNGSSSALVKQTFTIQDAEFDLIGIGPVTNSNTSMLMDGFIDSLRNKPFQFSFILDRWGKASGFEQSDILSFVEIITSALERTFSDDNALSLAMKEAFLSSIESGDTPLLQSDQIFNYLIAEPKQMGDEWQISSPAGENLGMNLEYTMKLAGITDDTIRISSSGPISMEFAPNQLALENTSQFSGVFTNEIEIDSESKWLLSSQNYQEFRLLFVPNDFDEPSSIQIETEAIINKKN